MAFPKIEGYVVTEKLGSGSYSTVYKAHTKVGARQVVAIKCVEKSRLRGAGAADNLLTEIRLLKKLSHPHIVQLIDFTWDARNIYIITEYCCGGDLSKYIRRYGRVPERQVLYFLQQLASALKYLREQGIVHMDLKPHNFLLHKNEDGQYILKVADFGFAAVVSSPSALGCRGTPLYMAPEMLAGRDCDAAVDLWSVGVIMFECLFGKAPYSSATFTELVNKILTNTPVQIPTSGISPGCRSLLSGLLQMDPAQRISYDDFLAHPYLDLEHMPSKENYDKAVSLLRCAVQRDGAGEAGAALGLYCAALRLLLPVAAAHPLRHALHARLRRYMDRAEQLKRQLAGDADAAETDTPAHVTGAAAAATRHVGTEELPAPIEFPPQTTTEPTDETPPNCDTQETAKMGDKKWTKLKWIGLKKDKTEASSSKQESGSTDNDNDTCRIT